MINGLFLPEKTFPSAARHHDVRENTFRIKMIASQHSRRKIDRPERNTRQVQSRTFLTHRASA